MKKAYETDTALSDMYNDCGFEFKVGMGNAKEFLLLDGLPTTLTSQFLKCTTQTEAKVCLKSLFKCITNIKCIDKSGKSIAKETVRKCLAQVYPIITSDIVMKALIKHDECCKWHYASVHGKTTSKERMAKCVEILKELNSNPQYGNGEIPAALKAIDVDIASYEKDPAAAITGAIKVRYPGKSGDLIKPFLADLTKNLATIQSTKHIRSKFNPLTIYKNHLNIDYVTDQLFSGLAL